MTLDINLIKDHLQEIEDEFKVSYNILNEPLTHNQVSDLYNTKKYDMLISMDSREYSRWLIFNYPERVRVRFYSDDFDKNKVDFINEFSNRLSRIYKVKLISPDRLIGYEIIINKK